MARIGGLVFRVLARFDHSRSMHNERIFSILMWTKSRLLFSLWIGLEGKTWILIWMVYRWARDWLKYCRLTLRLEIQDLHSTSNHRSETTVSPASEAPFGGFPRFDWDLDLFFLRMCLPFAAYYDDSLLMKRNEFYLYLDLKRENGNRPCLP